jgi:hypothetical protein
VLTNYGIQTAALIAATSIAKNAGTATLSGYTIPTSDQLGNARPATPAVGAVEYVTSTSVRNTNKNKGIEFIARGNEFSFTGLSGSSEVKVYDMSGVLLLKTYINNNETFNLNNVDKKLVFITIEGQSFKTILQ